MLVITPRARPLILSRDGRYDKIAVEHPGDGATEIYNVAISDERQAMDAVRACVHNANGIVVKVKSQLTRRLCKALKLRPGEVRSNGA
jgi:hypothetical protein